MRSLPKLVLATTGLTLALTSLDVKYVSAAIITYNFIVESPTNRGEGFFSFDDTTFSDEAIPVAPVQSLSFRFDSESIIYNEQDDVNFPDFPVVFSTEFLTGQSSIGLDYQFDDRANPGSNFSYEIIGEDFIIFSRTSPNTEIVTGTVSYTRVPEPTTLAASFVTCSVCWFMKKKGALVKKVKV